ncbi:hypothetical protein RRG08_062565 [Elysia crispata]|uniref:Uncharacterized protein n=1 Tax=Elysia crispata TaxID=231223 RepID=A0AAE1ANB0_9GAST|nr:hypothetical protein RRG08_062565 [Elysia crispata]
MFDPPSVNVSCRSISKSRAGCVTASDRSLQGLRNKPGCSHGFAWDTPVEKRAGPGASVRTPRDRTIILLEMIARGARHEQMLL